MKYIIYKPTLKDFIIWLTILILALLVFTLFSGCKKVDTVTAKVNYSIEGKWLLENAGGSNLPPNTMYEFRNGLKYTYYGGTENVDDSYWLNLDSSYAIPNPSKYTFTNDSLRIDSKIVYKVAFDCDGNLINIDFPGVLEPSTWRWWRIGTDPRNCN